MRKVKLLLVGPFPKPIGGVSIHLERLKALISKEIEVLSIDESPIKKTDISNIRFFDWVDYIKFFKRTNIVHIHSSLLTFRLFHIFLARYIFKKPIILTIHSLRQKRIGKIENFLYQKCWKILIVNETYRSFIKNHNILFMPAFIPPIKLDDAIPDNVKSWVDNKRKEGNKLLVSNAYQLSLFQGVDIYGLDLAIELMERVKNSNDNMVLVFVVSSLEKGRTLYEKYQDEIKSKGLEDRFLLVGGAINFPKLVLDSDLVLRLTCTDGDALTIRESLWLNKKVLASDVVKRPDGCSLFKNRDSMDLYKSVNKVLSEENYIAVDKIVDYKKLYLDLYRK